MDVSKMTQSPELEVLSPSAADVESVELVIVDDNVDAADTLAALLNAKGHNVVTRYDAFTTLQFCEQKSVQVFILDISLPDMDGYELLQKLKPKMPNALFIALTGYEQPREYTLSPTDGFDHYFVKPINVEKLTSLLNQFQLAEQRC